MHSTVSPGYKKLTCKGASHIDFVYKKRHDPPHPPPLRNVTNFFRQCRGPLGIIFLARLRTE